MNIILPNAYAGNIAYYSLFKNASECLIEISDHYEKQSYRNRCEIYGANGKLKLIIPLERRGTRILTSKVKVDNDQKWQKLHWRSLESGYRSSPYFEYYEDRFKPFFQKEYEYLVDFNKDIHDIIVSILKLDIKHSYTRKYQKEYDNYKDLRKTIHPKKTLEQSYPQKEYMQVFDSKYGYIRNLSILDLIFNEGPRAETFL